MTAGDPARAHPATPHESVSLDRLLRVAGAGRLVATTAGEPGEKHPVEPDRADPDPTSQPPHLRCRPSRTPPCRRSRWTAPTIASWSASTTAGRAMMRTSQPGWNAGAITLSTARSRRRTRFRTTAPPSFRPVDNPKRVVSRFVRRNRAWRSGWDREVPRRCSAAKSFGREIVTSRGASVPRPSVRPTVASGRGGDARQGPDARPWSSSGLGSRAPWRDGASWAGTSASWGWRAILSMSLGGASATLGGTRTRRAPVSAWRVVVRRMIGRPEQGCQTPTRSRRRTEGRARPAATDGRDAEPRLARSPHRAAMGTLPYSQGVWRNQGRIALQLPSGRCYPSPSQRRRDARWGAFGHHRPSPMRPP